MEETLHLIFGPDLKAALLIILNLIIIESLLSVDNAVVIATMVMDLPPHQRKKALRYGILGAYFFRGLCLVLAAWVIKIWWLKPLGGLYLVYLCVHYFLTKDTKTKDDDTLNKDRWKIYQWTVGKIGLFWSTVIMVELVDLAFSIDNVFAALALANNIPEASRLFVVMAGVFIGILAIRFIAQGFIRLLEKYPALEMSAFVVIGLLGVKLILSGLCHIMSRSPLCQYLESEKAGLYFSLFTLVIFLFPIIISAVSAQNKKD